MSDPLLRAGRLLVASPTMRDPNFERSVVLLLEYGDDGALGIVLNRPTDTDLYAAVPGGWERLAAEPPVIFVGGPVAPAAAICLARSPADYETEGWTPLFGGLGTVDLNLDPDLLETPLQAVRVFAGYAGWAPGQAEAEVDEGAWFVLDALPGDALSTDPDDLWRSVLLRQGGDLALLANFPDDPALN
ncbi:MAG: YqgE/AlgH family protein [Actinomycetota bacterium]|nr:YqgE/AlgH family protein [Actinomycetota bacterium]